MHIVPRSDTHNNNYIQWNVFLFIALQALYAKHYVHRRIVLIHVQFIFSHEIRFVFALKQSLLARTQYMRERCIYARCCDFYVSAFTKQLSPNSAFLPKILIRLDIITIIFQQYFDKNSHTFYSVAKCSVLPLCQIFVPETNTTPRIPT